MQLLSHSVSIALVTIAVVIWALGALVAIFTGRKTNSRVMSAILMAGCLSMLGGVLTVWPHSAEWAAPPPIYLGLAPLAMRIDPLASLFLGLLAFVGCSVSLFSPRYLDHLQNRFNPSAYWICLFLFVLSMAEVLLSANALTFMVFWELMSLSSVALVATEHVRHKAQRSAFIYLGATRVSTAFLIGAFLWLHGLFHSWNFADWDFSSGKALAPAFLLLIGLCIKAGIWPFHLWLPYAHPEAPAPVSALMSGVMVKVALYMMIRTLILGGSHDMALGYVALALGFISAVWGVLFALIEKDLKRLLAFSTVENVGLILTAIALAIMCRSANLPLIAALALVAALFHSLNHGLFKSLLFLGAGAVDASAHTRDMAFLGGLAKAMPWTMVFFFVGSIAICALPPLNGFASKWFIYQSLFKLSFNAPTVVDRGISLTLVGVLSFVGALSLACFTKAVGITFLGRARSMSANQAHESAPSMLAGQGLLAVACVVVGLFVPQTISSVFAPICLSCPVDQAAAGEAFVIPQTALAAALLTLIAVAYITILSSKKNPVREYVTWDCGYGELPARTEETGTSYSEPIARIFSPVLQYRMFTEIKGKDRRHFPEAIHMELNTPSILEEKIYRPCLGVLQKISELLVTFQTGSIHVHLLYVFLTLLLLVILGVSI